MSKTKKYVPKHSRDPYTAFRRILHSKGTDLRAGLSIARTAIDPENFAGIVQKLAHSPIYAQAIAPNPFPRTPSELPTRKRLASVAATREFLWTSSVLSMHVSRLTRFVTLRDDYDRAFLIGDYEQASGCLKEIESAYGISFWLIARRIHLLQLQYGLKAQKDYLESVIGTSNLGPYTAYLIFFMSYRAEENVSLAMLRTECADIRAVPGIGDHFIYHVIPADLKDIVSPTEPIVWEETQPIIDRWQAFVLMSQLHYAREGDACAKYLHPALKAVKEAHDPNVDVLLELMAGRLPGKCPTMFDDYTEGNYAALPPCATSLEMSARAGLFSAEYKDGFREGSPGLTAVRAIRNLLASSEGFTQSQNRLEKIALAGDKSGWAMELIGFLHRERANSTGYSQSDADSLAALCSAQLNPWAVAVFSRLMGNRELLGAAIQKYPYSTSLLLLRSLSESPAAAHATINSLPIPQYRKLLYEGHVRMRHGDSGSAINYYKEAASAENSYVVACARRFLYEALYIAHGYSECLDLVVDDCMKYPGAYRSYPIEELLGAVRSDESGNIDELALAILMQFAARYIDPRWERDMSDSYDNALHTFGVRTPSELLASERVTDVPRDRLVFFLRHVCVQRILDDSTAFASVEDVEAERILICQELTQLDSANSNTYVSEIRAITQDAEVAHVIQQIEGSKIYVDEEGLKGYVEEQLKALFERHQALLQSPSLEYQAEQLAKRLKEMVSDKKAPADLKNLRLPPSEREGLFESMLRGFISEFAFNPAYGLDIHLSTSIRHGVFEGHIRAPFTAEDLLSGRDGEKYLSPVKWARCHWLTENELEIVHKQLMRLTQRIEAEIPEWLTAFLRIRTPSGPGTALFEFRFSEEESRELIDSISSSTPYEEFVNRLFAFCWRKVDSSLYAVREGLKSRLLPKLIAATDALIGSLESSIGHAKSQRLVDSAVRAKTIVHSEIERICEWFNRPSDMQRSPFDMDLAIRVAIRQIDKIYQPLSAVKKLAMPFKIQGEYLDGIVEVIFLLLQNVIRHGGVSGNPSVDISVVSTTKTIDADCTEGHGMVICVANDLGPSVDVSLRIGQVAEAQQRYAHDTAMKLAGREGGSGLSKLWRILQFDLKVEHRLALEIDQADRRFTASLEISGVRTC
jgi:hypothetical protein